MAGIPKNNGGNVNGGTSGGYVPGQPRPYQKPDKPASTPMPKGQQPDRGARTSPNPRNVPGKSAPDYNGARDR